MVALLPATALISTPAPFHVPFCTFSLPGEIAASRLCSWFRAVGAQADQPAHMGAVSRRECCLSCPHWGAILNPTSRESRRISIAEISSPVLNLAEGV